MLSRVKSRIPPTVRITRKASQFAAVIAVCLGWLGWAGPGVLQADEQIGAEASAQHGESFYRAWQAARSGNRDQFHQLMPGLQDYLLYPYLQYEDLRFRRATVPPDEMASFLESHAEFPFTNALRNAWLRTLGKNSQWDALLEYALSLIHI